MHIQHLRRIAKFQFLLVLWGISFSAHSADWSPIVSGGGISIYVDRTSVATYKHLRKASVTYDLEEARTLPDGVPYLSSLQTQYYDCQKKVGTAVRSVFYSENSRSGTVVGRSSVALADAKFTEYSKDSLGESLIEFVCSQDL